MLAATFVLTNGETVDGDVHASTNNTMMIRLANGALLPVALPDIATVRLSLGDDREISGRLVGWRGPAYEVMVAGHRLEVVERAGIKSLEQKTEGYRLASNAPSERGHALAVVISTLIKLRLLPRTGIDLWLVPSGGYTESLALLDRAEADFAVVSKEAIESLGDDIATGRFRSIATLQQDDKTSTQLLARSEVDADSVFKIMQSIFDSLPFLEALDSRLAGMSLDDAPANLSFPLHAGALRYYDNLGFPAVDHPDPASARQ